MSIPFHYFTYNGRSSLEFNTKISGNGTFAAPQRDIEKQEVPGRSGDLLIDNGKFKNITIPYEAYITEDFDKSIAALRAFLLSTSGYLRLEDTYHPDEFRLAAYAGPFDPKVHAVSSGSFTLEFDCMPQRFLKSGEIAFRVNAGEAMKIWNPCEYIAKPEIIVTGTGTFQVNDVTAQVAENSRSITIDSEIQECYEGTTNRNSAVSLSGYKFPELVPGENVIAAGENIYLQIKPRWWTI